MRELGFEGLSEDRRFLIVHDPSTDKRYRVRLDDETQALVEQPAEAPAPSTGSEPAMEAIALNPRDIQTRIRRGESAQQVADALGVPLERVAGFAAPVIAEREYMSEQAQKTSIRRKHVTGAGMLLGPLVDAGIVDLGGNPESAVWDSWRREDGRWTVLVTPEGSDTTATYLYDVQGRYVICADELAHELVGDVALADTPDMAIADVVRSQAVAPPPAPPEPELEQLDELDDDLDDEDDADLTPSAAEAELPPDIAAAEALLDAAARSRVASLKDARDRRTQEALARQEAEAAADSQIQSEVDHLEDAIDTDVAVPDTSGPRKKRPERRRVPSWDEIMFGDKND